MKRMLSFCGVVLLVCLACADAYSQAVDLKIVAMSPGMRSTGYPSFSSPPAGTPNYVSTGLRTVAKGMKVYLKADTTGSSATKVTSYAWTFTAKPTGSTATFSDAAKDSVTFIPDVTGQYIVQIAVNGGAKTHVDTIFASTFGGITTLQQSCVCHSATPSFQDSYNNWKTSKHATIFSRGMTGQLENAEETSYRGAYTKSCFRCHTSGWESVTDNGNFGFLANVGAKSVPPVSFDSLWWRGLATSGGDYLIPYKDSTVYKKLTPEMLKVGSIGCESCHGPAVDHAMTADKKKISVSPDGGVCNQCHESPKGHSIGYFWRGSNHATMKTSAGEASNTGCWPCHNGSSFIKITDAWKAGLTKPTAADSLKIDRNFTSISCAVCHDPHSNANEFWIRYMKIDTLANGFKVPVNMGGMGQLCMNCHRGRANYATTVKNQFGRFSSRFYPHYSSQADMFVGTQGWDFGLGLEGLSTHGGLKKGCVNCHMSERTVVAGYTKSQPDHNTSMSENGVDKVEGCIECHGSIKSFRDIKASADYDMDGKLEGAVAEVEGLMAKLKSKLPVDATGEPVTTNTDSMIVKNYVSTNRLNYQTVIAATWNYNYVKYDMSAGVHNTKYAVALLKASIEQLQLGAGASSIVSVKDVPFDNGRKIQVVWNQFPAETFTVNQVVNYGVWRKDPMLPSLNGVKKVNGFTEMMRVTAEGGQVLFGGSVWSFVGGVPATGLPQYSFIAPTLFDSTKTSGQRWSVFYIAGYSKDNQAVYSTQPDSGYSTDNIAPLAPTGTSASFVSNGINLKWKPNVEEDVYQYAVYRGTASGFNPAGTSPIATVRTPEYRDAQIQSGVTYYYKVSAIDVAGNESGYTAFTVVTKVEDGQELPTEFALNQNYPNPFNPTTEITFSIPKQTAIKLVIYGISGDVVATLINQTMSAGNYRVAWNGRSDDGRFVASGVYFYHLQSDRFTATKKMTFMK